MGSRGGVVVGAILAAAVLAGCSDGPDEGTAPSPGPVEIACEASIGRAEPDAADWMIVDEAVALPSAERPALQAVEVDTLADETWWWAKQGISVRGTSRIELEVPAEHLHEMRIGWGGAPATPAVSVIVECDPPMDSWLAFAGGYWVSEPGCYPLDVRVDGGTAREVHVGIGAACPGQEPPAPLPSPVG